MRDVAEQTLDSTAVVQSKTYASDGGGGGTTVWAASGTVACHLSPIPAYENDEREIAERIAADADWIVTVPAETSVTTENRIVTEGKTLNVEACHAPRTWEITTRLEAREIV